MFRDYGQRLTKYLNIYIKTSYQISMALFPEKSRYKIDNYRVLDVKYSHLH